MDDDLVAAYPAAADYIWDAVEEHGEEWVRENYYTQIHPLGSSCLSRARRNSSSSMWTHETMSQADLTEIYEAWGQYRENLRIGTKSTEDSDPLGNRLLRSSQLFVAKEPEEGSEPST
ncbi:hypothetical protein [Halohasta litchfieldiae]|jgi:hypothetical protein|uniref:hypothetical protein n=1 Tax=Halohasta litchfieldiae TaxID=1073996 RepID=UPI002AA2AE8A|nr:hypothetical protein [Halohasta litchfieldiae]